jgi:hypothetical protein
MPDDKDPAGQRRVANTGDGRVRLKELERVIEQGLTTFVGRALVEIRESRLYATTGHATWDDYCRERWGLSKTHANRQIDAAQVQDRLRPIDVTLPNEHVARMVKPYVAASITRVVAKGEAPDDALQAVVDRAKQEQQRRALTGSTRVVQPTDQHRLPAPAGHPVVVPYPAAWVGRCQAPGVGGAHRVGPTRTAGVP